MLVVRAATAAAVMLSLQSLTCALAPAGRRFAAAGRSFLPRLPLPLGAGLRDRTLAASPELPRTFASVPPSVTSTAHPHPSKREARRAASERRRAKNLALRDDGQMYAARVIITPDLKAALEKQNGGSGKRERKGRLFFPLEGGDTGHSDKTLRWMRTELHGLFAGLKKDTYTLEGAVPEIDDEGKQLFGGEEDWRALESDSDVRTIFITADETASAHPNSTVASRPPLLIRVGVDPNAPPPPPTPHYLRGMPDPASSSHMTMLSFYAFPPGGLGDAGEFAIKLKSWWRPFGAAGRVYVAEEGVNAQMAVPTNVVGHFRICCRAIPELGEHMENGINIDPVPLTMDEYSVAGVARDGKAVPPFKALHIRVRPQVVADGLDKPLDWQSAGYDMPPEEWHEKLKHVVDVDIESGDATLRDPSTTPAPIILDCRNSYETGVGRFVGAVPLGTDNFRESWDVLKEQLKDTPKDSPIMAYCTGGIRCVKVGAYLTQKMGFSNVSRLAGGIVAYDRAISSGPVLAGGDKAQESLFRGTNYVFDGRVGRAITDDAMGKCVTCGEATAYATNCANAACHIRMIQCAKCRESYDGACSDACRTRVLNKARVSNGAMVSRREAPAPATDVGDYALSYSSPAPPLFDQIEKNTHALLPSGSHMVSGTSQGRLLTALASMARLGRVLEVGTFTGYATACLVEGSASAGRAGGLGAGGPSGGPFVLSLERDRRAFELAAMHLSALAQYGVGEEAAAAAAAGVGDAATKYGDATSLDFLIGEGASRAELRLVTDALAEMETGLDGVAPFDLVFLDADKGRMLEYVETLVGNDNLLSPGGTIIVDNVLWKGAVVQQQQQQHNGGEDPEDGELGAEHKVSRRAKKLAGMMHRFNEAVVQDDRMEVVILPLRDGLSIIRKK